MASQYDRKFPTTGYWIFYCNTRLWRGDEWLALGDDHLWYKVSDHHRSEMVAGQKGVIRFNSRKATRNDRGLEVGIYAIVEVLGPVEFRPDSDLRHYGSSTELPKPTWRVPLRITSNLLENPILARALPAKPEFDNIRRGLQTASLALSESAFHHVLTLAGVDPDETEADLSALSPEELANTPLGVRRLEVLGRDDPKRQSRLSRYIERGTIGKTIKRELGGRCQFCEGLGAQPICFLKKGGGPYSEAHHVVPVSQMAPGSLGRANIIVLCPNHHRQAHYGDVTYRDRGEYWIFEIDGQPIKIVKPPVSLYGK